ncbi:hypothetical protein FQR65_LT12297 [Abscondita terminalis]|nr:hypothetical protein FQR65_LT12297 [Abscondita terminalis]
MLAKKTVLLFLCVASNFGDEDDAIFSKFFQHDYDIKDIRIDGIDYNKDFIQDLYIVYRKYNRTTKAVNLTALAFVDLTMNNNAVFIQVYKRYGNEFKQVPGRFAFKICQALQGDVAGISTFTSGNISCPIKKNVRLSLSNWIPDFSHLPPLIPEGEYMAQVNSTYQKQYLYKFNAFATVYRQVKIPKN